MPGVEGQVGPRREVGDDLEHARALVAAVGVVEHGDRADVARVLGVVEVVNAVGDDADRLAAAVQAAVAAHPVGVVDRVALGEDRSQVDVVRAGTADAAHVRPAPVQGTVIAAPGRPSRRPQRASAKPTMNAASEARP